MNNAARRVLNFVLLSFCIYFGLSLMLTVCGFDRLFFRNINLLSEVFLKKTEKLSSKIQKKNSVPEKKEGPKSLELFEQGKKITSFSPDNTAIALPRLMQKLQELKSGEKKIIRIAYFGDSMIEGDLMTGTLRKLLQKSFGGAGVGFVPVRTPSSKFSLSVSSSASDWRTESFKTKPKTDLFLSGYCYYPKLSDELKVYDRSVKDSQAILSKYLFTGLSEIEKSFQYNGENIRIPENNRFNKSLLSVDKNHGLHLTAVSENIPVFGVSIESEVGVIVDNFSFRGITGIELNQLKLDFLLEVAEKNQYDLIVFQYGVNMLFRPNDTGFSWYKKMFDPVLKKFKNCFPESEFLLISSADRAFRYNGVYGSAVGIVSLLKTQAELAMDNKICFYNQFLSMGGRGSIVHWADSLPSLANKDYVHPNFRGAEKLASFLFEAMMKDYNSYLKQTGK